MNPTKTTSSLFIFSLFSYLLGANGVAELSAELGKIMIFVLLSLGVGNIYMKKQNKKIL